MAITKLNILLLMLSQNPKTKFSVSVLLPAHVMVINQ